MKMKTVKRIAVGQLCSALRVAKEKRSGSYPVVEPDAKKATLFGFPSRRALRRRIRPLLCKKGTLEIDSSEYRFRLSSAFVPMYFAVC